MAISKTSGTERSVSSVAKPNEGGEVADPAAGLERPQRSAPSRHVTDDEGAGEAVPASVIHELRTPLTAIHGYAQVLQRALRSDPSKARAATVVLSESTRLAALLNQLSELTEIDAGTTDSAPMLTDVRELVDGLVDQKAKGAPDHAFTVEGTASMRVDPRRLGQALSHLIDNAVAYAPDGGAVTIRIECHPDNVHVQIADEGIGVLTDEGDRIFQRYQRGSNARRAGVRGLGIGLYVARQAIAREGGRIWHTPADGRGTVFHLSVPTA